MAVKKEQPKPVTRILSFSDLQTVNIDVVITLPDGSEGIVPMRSLSYAEWMRLGMDVPAPVPPVSGVDKNARPILDFNDPGYQRDLANANMRRMNNRLLAALRIDIPGSTPEEKIAALETQLDGSIVPQLAGVLNRMYGEREARIQARAETFHTNGTGGDSNLSGAEDQPAGVLDTAAAAR